MVEDENSVVDEDLDDGSGDAEIPRRRSFFIIAGVVLLSLLLIGGYVIWNRNAATKEEAEEVVVSVKVAKAEKDSIAKEVSAIGTVVPAERADVAASISAQIRQMGVLKNQLVKHGDPVAVLSSEDLIAQRNEAQAALDEARLNLQTVQKVQIPQSTAQSTKDVNDAKAAVDNTRATYERRQVLYQKGGISLKELEASQLAYTNAQDAYHLAVSNEQISRGGVNPNSQSIAVAKIKQAQDRLANIDVQVSRGTVRAPISGIVTDQFQYEGEFAQQGAKLVTIADISTVIVKAQFADNVVHDLKVGNAVTVYPLEAPDEKMTGAVSLISRSSDPQNRTVEVWARFGNPRGLLPANGAVQFVVESQPVEDAVVVPSSAVVLDATNAEEGTVMVVGTDMIARETKVKVGVKQSDKTQIVEGLEGGETVVIEGNYSLPDGTKVEVAADEGGGKEE
ncbi:MAG TPA: efflux RND transporter periplasmic adaptor subunit [Pyrinomonadaceae bacterium]|jgi:RND family efflux transporter MFP subunit|nr:efflux RND transporter periplasmic adaptor subunit [Pyrinomonadaceae bacterium]